MTGNNGKFMEIAESTRGPQIIVHGHTAAVQFYINKHLPETCTVLNNFVLHFTNKIYNNEKVGYSAQESRLVNKSLSNF